MPGDISPDVAIVLLNMGGPATEEQVEPYLRELFSDPAILDLPGPLRKMLARSLARRRAPRSAERYRLHGGASRLLRATEAQAQHLEKVLHRPVRAVMRYSQPRAVDVLAELAERGVTRIVALPLYPQYSTTTTASSLQDLREAAAGTKIDVTTVESWPSHPGLIAALADAASRAIKTLDEEAAGKAHLLFAAHGIPQRRVRRGDPYPQHVQVTAAAVVAKLELELPWTLAWQSRIGPIRWLGPDIEAETVRLASSGVEALVVQPLSFVSENLETMDDLDRVLAEVAGEAGIKHFRRGVTPGTHPAFIEALADLALCAAGERGWVDGDDDA